MQILTSSRLRTFRECARKHDLAYVQGYRPVRDAEPLRFGTLIHAGLEAWWLAAAGGIDDRLGAALAAVAGEADPFDRVRAEELLRGYELVYGATVLDEFEILDVESRFDAPLLNPETLAASRTWRLGGKVDVTVRRRATSRVAVLEHKTSSDALDDLDYWARLAIDHQISAYVVGAEAAGHEVEDTVYDVIKKPGIRPFSATPPEVRKYTKDGRLYAAQHENDETPDEYRARLAADIAENPLKYFARRAIPRLNSQVQDFLFDAWQTGRQIREAELAGRAPRNPDACLRFGRCAYWDVCVNGLKPEEHPDLFRKLANVNPELGDEPAPAEHESAA